MYLLDLLSTAGGPEKRWFILFQDYLFYALLFVSGPVGLFVNMWSGETLTCIPVLNCTANPGGSVHCLKDKADEVWQQIQLPLTTHLSDVCMENHTLPFYVLYAYVPVFGGAVVAWLLHNLWLKVPPYARIARLYGNLDREQRDQVVTRLESVVEVEGEQAAALNEAPDDTRDMVVKALIKLLNRKCVPKLHVFYQFWDFINMWLCGCGGAIIITYVFMRLEAPVPCDIGNDKIFLSVNYTSISCSLHNEVGAKTLYILCAAFAILIGTCKLLLLLYPFIQICYGCYADKQCSWCRCWDVFWGACCNQCSKSECSDCGCCECSMPIRNDADMLRLLLAENTTGTRERLTEVTREDIHRLKIDGDMALSRTQEILEDHVKRCQERAEEHINNIQSNMDKELTEKVTVKEFQIDVRKSDRYFHELRNEVRELREHQIENKLIVDIPKLPETSEDINLRRYIQQVIVDTLKIDPVPNIDETRKDFNTLLNGRINEQINIAISNPVRDPTGSEGPTAQTDVQTRNPLEDG